MDYRKGRNAIYLRIDKGEKVVETIKRYVKRNTWRPDIFKESEGKLNMLDFLQNQFDYEKDGRMVTLTTRISCLVFMPSLNRMQLLIITSITSFWAKKRPPK